MPTDPPTLIGVIGSQGCSDPPCDAYPFEGFEDPLQKYQTVTIYDWDCCLYGPDAISGDSAGGETSPSTWTSSDGCCFTVSDAYGGGKAWAVWAGHGAGECPNPDTQFSAIVAKQKCECENPDGKVDGHITYKALNDCYAIVTDGAGNTIVNQPIGTIVTVASIKSTLDARGDIDSDTKAYWNVHSEYCGNADGHQIFFILSDPEP